MGRKTEEWETADDMADIMATMGYALQTMMTLNRDELLSKIETFQLPIAKPTADLDFQATLANPIPNPSTRPPARPADQKEEKYSLILPEVEQGSTTQLAQLQEWMELFAAAVVKPYIFVEGSATLFSSPLADPEYQSFATELFRISQQTRVPLVGCVRRPITNDLISLMKLLFPNEPTIEVSDAGLLQVYLQYGEHTPVFYWELADQEICFVYLKTDVEMRPARIEFPKWLYEINQHEKLFSRILFTSFLNVNFPERFKSK